MPSINPLPLLFTSLLTIHGLRRRSISPSGSIVGFIIGYIFLSSKIYAFPTALLIFYLLGSYATRLGASRKSQLEQDHDVQGYRTAAQVLSNSLPALVATLLWHRSFAATYDPTAWCPTSPGYTRALVLAILGHFACCLGDTLASELGILSTHPPILITTLRSVPPGTNGAISFGGTLASIFGGALIGAGMGLSLVIENSVCRHSPFSLAGTLVLWGAVAGGVGSLIDSLLGATLQRTRYSPSSKQILQDNSTPSADTTVISGLPILSNNQVNLVSASLTALLLSMIA